MSLPGTLADWFSNAGIPCRSEADAAAFLRLDEALGGAETVFLGEMNHFIHEKSDFRLLFASHLVPRGWRTLMEEIGWSDGWRIGRYLAGGDPAWLERLSLFGYRGDQRTDRDDNPTGIFKASFASYPHALMRAEQERFYRPLRTFPSEPLFYFGVDIDGSPGGGYADIGALTDALSADRDMASWRAGLGRVTGESIDAEIARLHRVKGAIPERLAPAMKTALAAALDALTDSLAYIQVTYPAKTYEETRPGMALREDVMKRHYATARTLAGRDTKIILMGHALHLAKNDLQLEGMAGVGPGGGRVFSLGHHIAQERRERVFSIWLIYGAGEDSQPLPDLPRVASYSADTLNAQLRFLDAPMLFVLSRAPDAVLDTPVTIGQMYNSTFRTRLRGQVDAILYLPTVTPMRPG